MTLLHDKTSFVCRAMWCILLICVQGGAGRIPAVGNNLTPSSGRKQKCTAGALLVDHNDPAEGMIQYAEWHTVCLES